jgi:hypothetical protein
MERGGREGFVLYDCLILTRILTLTMDKIFICTPEITKKIATDTIRNRKSSHTKHVFIQPTREVGAVQRLK